MVIKLTKMTPKEQVYKFLAEVPDPEIPVINIVELGVIRDVLFYGSYIEILLTPTYSGCPAMDMIEKMIKEKLHSKDYESVKVTLVYKPVWTTDWMNEETKEKLRAFGIAPPKGVTSSKKTLLNEESIACPQCKSENTELKSMFSSTACKALYICSDCLEPFDYFKCI
jgi:ring-1,2-phenylacetyl-CoA epoxidase subunit PaaD